MSLIFCWKYFQLIVEQFFASFFSLWNHWRGGSDNSKTETTTMTCKKLTFRSRHISSIPFAINNDIRSRSKWIISVLKWLLYFQISQYYIFCEFCLFFDQQQQQCIEMRSRRRGLVKGLFIPENLTENKNQFHKILLSFLTILTFTRSLFACRVVNITW